MTDSQEKNDGRGEAGAQLRVLGVLMLLCGLGVFGWQQYLDWSEGYSRRGMEAVVYLLMWGVSGGLGLLGFLLLYIGGRMREKNQGGPRE